MEFFAYRCSLLILPALAMLALQLVWAQQQKCIFPEASFHSSFTNATKCYRAFTIKLDWPHARVVCKLWGGHLLTVNAADENRWVSEILLPSVDEYDKAWTGLHSYESFFWSGPGHFGGGGQTNMIPLGNQSLNPSYPLHCGYISAAPNNKGAWQSQECWSNYSFVCEKPFVAADEQAIITTTTETAQATTCSPFGAVASCSDKNLEMYGIVVPDRGSCLILGGFTTNTTWLSWASANMQCKSILNGNLVDVDDDTKWQAVYNLVVIASARSGAVGTWIGLQSSYRWSDGKKLSFVPNHSSLANSAGGLCYAFANLTSDYNSTICSDSILKMPYICQVAGCPLGMTAVPDCKNTNYICVEENECHDGKADCGQSTSAGTCVDQPHDQGQYECHCLPGFMQLNGNDSHSVCVDIRECDDKSTCEQQVQGGLCIEQYGSYLCACENGYRLLNGTCAEVDECVEQNNPCGVAGVCSNAPGSYTCSCSPGYQQTNGKCVDINECALSVYPCGIPTAQAFCNNQLGYSSSWPRGFTCDCSSGYKFMTSSSTCVQFDNCHPDGSSTCGSDANVRCVSYEQQFYCACSGGQNFNSLTGLCEPINLVPFTYGDSGSLILQNNLSSSSSLVKKDPNLFSTLVTFQQGGISSYSTSSSTLLTTSTPVSTTSTFWTTIYLMSTAPTTAPSILNTSSAVTSTVDFAPPGTTNKPTTYRSQYTYVYTTPSRRTRHWDPSYTTPALTPLPPTIH